MSIADSIEELKKELPTECVLVAVSKTKPLEDIMLAYEAGQRHFGENKVQEMTDKEAELPNDIKWHFIGHLQTNKVKYIVPFVHLIHSVDSLKLLKEINKRAHKAGRKVDCLIQMYIADEETKFGFDEGEILELMTGSLLDELSFVNIRGLMGMATYSDDMVKVRSEFRRLSSVFDECKKNLLRADFSVLSMGMTGDYKIAIEEGSNMVRIGSLIFGERNKDH